MPERSPDAADVAEKLTAELERRNLDYAVGGAIALGYWAQPRGTVDVDITLFLPPDTAWARKRLEEIYGRRDPRLAAWDELVAGQS